MDRTERQLWVAAKLAVRAHAKDRSKRNAVQIELAWEKLRLYNTLAILRRMRRQWKERNASSRRESVKSGTHTPSADRLVPNCGPSLGRSKGAAR